MAGHVRLGSLACRELHCGCSDWRLASFPELKLVPFVGSALEEGWFGKQTQKELRLQSCVHEWLTQGSYCSTWPVGHQMHRMGCKFMIHYSEGALYLSNFLLSPGVACVTGSIQCELWSQPAWIWSPSSTSVGILGVIEHPSTSVSSSMKWASE